MKGYAVLAALTACVHVLIPVLLLEPASDRSVIQSESSQVSVQHTASTQTSLFDTSALAMYETMGIVAPDAPLEAVKAVYVANYTQFQYQKLANKQEQADVVSTTMEFPTCYTEAYWKEQWGEAYDERYGRFQEAMTAVQGQCILYEDQPIMALIHTMNTGNTEDASVLFDMSIPYLKSVASPADAASTAMISSVAVPLEQARETLKKLCGAAVDEKAETWFSDVQTTTQKTVKSLKIGSVSMSGEQIRQAFSLPSAAFEAAVQGDQAVFTVYGNGHFVGLSVTGACAMAQDGQTYEQILKHYYRGVTIQ